MTGTAPALASSMGFDEASRAVDYLHDHVPLGQWSVTRFDGSQQVHLEVAGDAYGVAAGTAIAWEDTFCRLAVAGHAPSVSGDVGTVPAYTEVAARHGVEVGAYAGIPIRRPDGELFGTLCGFDPEARDGELEVQRDLLELLSTLLAAVLDADEARTDAARQLEREQQRSETDELTGLLNRRGWMRFLEREEARYRRFGDPGAVIVIDLDRLEEVDDRWGHAAGDEHLRLAARTITHVVRASDTVARLGGARLPGVAARG